MINKILNFYGYIRKDQIKDKVTEQILSSNKKLRDELIRDLSIAKERCLDEQMKEHSINIGKMNARIIELMETNKELKKKILASQKAYKQYRNNALRLEVFSENLGTKVKDILERSAYFFKEFKEIENTINNHVRVTVRDDLQNSKLLDVAPAEKNNES